MMRTPRAGTPPLDNTGPIRALICVRWEFLSGGFGCSLTGAPFWPHLPAPLHPRGTCVLIKVLKLYTPRREAIARAREARESRHDRGYDSVWTRRAARYMARFPCCQECERKDIIVPAAVVDHKIPVRNRPDLRLDPKNWWSLCAHCHQGIKRRMEAYAEKASLIDALMSWCDDPSTRPAALQQASRRRQVKETMVV